MIDENGKEMTEEQIIKESLELLSNCCCLLYETNSDTGHALAFMVDNCLKYGQVILRGDDVLSAAADYTKYENEVYRSKMKNSK